MDRAEATFEFPGQSTVERTSEVAPRTIEVDFRNDPRWTNFISRHPDALIYHHPGWLSALESEYGWKCVALACEGPDSTFQAILPLLPTRGLPFRIGRHATGRRLSSLPRTPLAGPVADTPLALKAILERAIELVREQDTQLEIKSTHSALNQLVPDLICAEWRGTYTRRLPNKETENCSEATRKARLCSSCDDCNQFRFGSARQNHQVRWAAKKAAKEGVTLRPAKDMVELRNWYQLYLRVMRRNAVPPRPFRFFETLYSELGPDGHLSLVLAELDQCPDRPAVGSDRVPKSNGSDGSHRSELISGSVLLRFGQTAFWAFTGSNELCLKLHANDLTLWNCLHDSCKLGFNWFDLGEVAETHPELVQFKKKWGTILQPTYRYYYPRSSAPSEHEATSAPTFVTKIVSAAWQKLPLNLVESLGDWAYKYL